MYIPVRLETVSKEAVYIAAGIREDGSKEVLAYTITPTESAYNWQEPLTELKERFLCHAGESMSAIRLAYITYRN